MHTLAGVCQTPLALRPQACDCVHYQVSKVLGGQVTTSVIFIVAAMYATASQPIQDQAADVLGTLQLLAQKLWQVYATGSGVANQHLHAALLA